MIKQIMINTAPKGVEVFSDPRGFRHYSVSYESHGEKVWQHQNNKPTIKELNESLAYVKKYG